MNFLTNCHKEPRSISLCRPFIRWVEGAKPLFAAIALALALADLRAQPTGGTVTFGNNNSCLVSNGPAARRVTTNDNVSAALYWAPVGSNGFVQIGAAVTNVGAPLPGIFVGGTRTTGTDTPGGASAQFRVRAWGGGYATYELASQHPGVLLGQSSVITSPTGDPGGTPPTPPVSIALNGLAGFTLTPGVSSSLTLTCATNKTVGCTNTWTFDNPTASSTCTNTNVTVIVLMTTTNGTCPQAISRTWQASDSCGNSSTCTQTVNVVDTQPPSLTCATNKTVNCTNAWDFDSPTAVTCTGSNLTANVLSTMTNGGCPQTIVRTWVAINPCNQLTNTCSQSVTVICTNCVVIQLTKNCPPYPVPPGGLLAFTGTITNRGTVTLTNLVVLNDRPVPNTTVLGPTTLAPGGGATFMSSYSVPACSCGPFSDTLTASATGVDGISYSNSVTATCAGTNYMVPGDLNGDGIVDQSELNAVLANYWGHSPWINMTNFARLCSNGLFQFSLTNASGWNFTVQVSTNLNTWSNLPAPAYPVYQFFDPQASSNAPNRFYRLRYP